MSVTIELTAEEERKLAALVKTWTPTATPNCMAVEAQIQLASAIRGSYESLELWEAREAAEKARAAA